MSSLLEERPSILRVLKDLKAELIKLYCRKQTDEHDEECAALIELDDFEVDYADSNLQETALHHASE